MINASYFLTALLIFFEVSCPGNAFGQEVTQKDTSARNSVSLLRDGCYKGTSQSLYADEPYWGIVSFKIKKGRYSGIRFMIRDSNLHETFDNRYEKHFAGNPVYIQQSRNDWAGVKKYPRKLARKQDIDKLDAISGATWSFNIFRASVNDALIKGERNSDTLSVRKGGE